MPETIFDLVAGETYVAHALTIYNGGLCALILDETTRPNWYPIEAFTVADGSMPAEWGFGMLADEPAGSQAVWGYPELVDNPKHMTDLTEREPEALEVFLQAAQRHAPSG